MKKIFDYLSHLLIYARAMAKWLVLSVIVGLLCGLLGLAMFLAAGASWVALKAPKPSDLQARAAGARFYSQIAVIVLFAAVSAYGHFLIAPTMAPELGIVRWICAILCVVAVVASLVFGRNGRDLHAFIAQSVAALALTFLLAASMFPNLVVAAAGSAGPSITVATAASSDLALAWMTGIACIGVPLVLVYHFLVYRAFRGRVE